MSMFVNDTAMTLPFIDSDKPSQQQQRQQQVFVVNMEEVEE